MLPGFGGMMLGYYTSSSGWFLNFCVGLFVAGFVLVFMRCVIDEAESAGLMSKKKD